MAGNPSPDVVLMIVVDDAGPELFGAYDDYYATTGQPTGNPAATPAIDSLLAGQGVTFTQAWSMPSCSPTRATILTGRYAFRTGVGSTTTVRPVPSRTGLASTEVLLPEVLHLAAQPYRCLAVGKWHLANRLQLEQDPLHPLGVPPGRWFDAWAGNYYGASTPEGLDPAVWGYSAWKKSFAAYLHSGSTPCAPQGPPCHVQMLTPPLEQYATVDTAEDAIACLQEATGPLFLYVAFNAIHRPLHDVPAGLPASTCGNYTPPVESCANPANLPEDPARARCMLEALDKQIARILCEVDFETTTVILVGDNGTSRDGTYSPYPKAHSKGSVYEGGIRVPLVIRSPLTPAGQRGTYQSAAVSTVDLFATTCEVVGIAPAGTPAVDSVSLVPYLTGVSAPLRTHVYSEDFYPNFIPDPATGGAPAGYGARYHLQALCDGRFKLIRKTRRAPSGTPPSVSEHFFDLLAGAPPAAGASTPTPDFFEEYDLLLAGTLSNEAASALVQLRSTLDADYPTLVQ